jgi:hypothetical protein
MKEFLSACKSLTFLKISVPKLDKKSLDQFLLENSHLSSKVVEIVCDEFTNE